MIEDQIDLILKAKAGDIAARNLLIETNIQFIKYVIWKYEGCSVRDRLGEGVIGFIRGIDMFDVNHKYTHPSNIFWSCIRGVLYETDKSEDRHAKYYKNLKDRILPRVHDIGPLKHAELNDVWDALSILSKNEKIVVTEHMMGTPFKEIAYQLRMTQQGVSYLYRRALEKLRAHFN